MEANAGKQANEDALEQESASPLKCSDGPEKTEDKFLHNASLFDKRMEECQQRIAFRETQVEDTLVMAKALHRHNSTRCGKCQELAQIVFDPCAHHSLHELCNARLPCGVARTKTFSLY
mgnify:FL=1